MGFDRWFDPAVIRDSGIVFLILKKVLMPHWGERLRKAGGGDEFPAKLVPQLD